MTSLSQTRRLGIFAERIMFVLITYRELQNKQCRRFRLNKCRMHLFYFIVVCKCVCVCACVRVHVCACTCVFFLLLYAKTTEPI